MLFTSGFYNFSCMTYTISIKYNWFCIHMEPYMWGHLWQVIILIFDFVGGLNSALRRWSWAQNYRYVPQLMQREKHVFCITTEINLVKILFLLRILCSLSKTIFIKRWTNPAVLAHLCTEMLNYQNYDSERENRRIGNSKNLSSNWEDCVLPPWDYFDYTGRELLKER